MAVPRIQDLRLFWLNARPIIGVIVNVPTYVDTTRDEMNELGSLLYVRAEAVAERLRALA